MTLRRRTLAQAAALLALPSLAHDALAQRAKDTLVLGMVLEPSPGLDPTTAPSAAIGEVVHYNVLEGLTKITSAGAVQPLLAEDWVSGPDGKTYTFKLRAGVKFQDGSPFNADAVKFSFDRARAADSTNKAKKTVFDNISSIATPQPDVVILTLNNPDATLPFRLGEGTAVILSPTSAATTATRPIGTGPFRLDSWQKGTAITLVKWEGYRDAAAIKLRRVTFRFINDNAAQVAALLAGDIDGMPRFGAVQNLKQLQADKRFTVEIGSTAGKGILAINNKRKPLDDVRVRRAISHAIDRKAFIDGVLEGLAKPIGSHAAPTDVGYIDLTGVYPFNPDKARALLKEAGISTPLNLTLTLPPPSYARKGGEVVAAMLAKVGINAKIENVEWAQWLSGAFKGNFDLTIINHVEPLDYVQYANPQYYWGYDSKAFNDLVKKRAESARGRQQQVLYVEIQRMLAADAVNAFLFNPSQVSVARRGLKGLWSSSPVFANDLSQVSWQ
ncbi:MAG: ABC transporter substrate-binding protein [Burkholderiales bacterium RIFCSPHIGHO2_12_FULL_69_20]|nr:MAG: ABC transporter substrate-binding protein [Burkholderiales bacterium RIFCSPHIGHO2_12_FULL_69_20]